MANNIHKGTEFNNINETWDQNERNRPGNNAAPGTEGTAGNDAPAANNLEQMIKEEAAEYDNVNKEERVLSGDRATVNDDRNTSADDE